MQHRPRWSAQLEGEANVSIFGEIEGPSATREGMGLIKLKVVGMGMGTADPRVVMHEMDSAEIGVERSDRVSVVTEGVPHSAMVCLTSTLAAPGELLISEGLMASMGLSGGEEVTVTFCPRPASVRHIRRSMDRSPLSREEVSTVMRDIMLSRISPTETAAWLTALHINGLSEDEVLHVTEEMVASGITLQFDRGPVFDFHSIGGVPGNKVTPLVVSIAAAAGLLIPKTSSRAISSACGTADFVEVFCDVELGAERLKAVAQETGGALAWGGAMNLTPVNGAIIETLYPLGIDPPDLMMASIMSKKMAMGANRLVMDIPCGPGAKVETLSGAKGMAQKFIALGERLGIHVDCALTDGRQPVGWAIGPGPEARECILALEGHNGLQDVREKAIGLAGMILDMGGANDGPRSAERLVDGGEALAKFQEIVAAQGGRADLSSADIPLGREKAEVVSPRSGYVNSIDNKELVTVARAAGAPRDKGSGIVLEKKTDSRVEEGELLFTIYADNADRAERALGAAERLRPLKVGGLLLERTLRRPGML